MPLNKKIIIEKRQGHLIVSVLYGKKQRKNNFVTWVFLLYVYHYIIFYFYVRKILYLNTLKQV